MSKQDRQGVRTATDLERRYNFGKKFSEVLGVASDAQEAADAAQDAADKINKLMTSEQIFNLLTNNGAAQGLYRDPETGDLYINASYLVTGIIRSKDGESVIIDLDNGNAKITGTLVTKTETADGKEYYSKVNPSDIWVGAKDESYYATLASTRLDFSTKDSFVYLFANRGGDNNGSGLWLSDTGGEFMLNVAKWCGGVWLAMMNDDRSLRLETTVSNERAYITGLTAPVDPADAVNKEYVDGAKSKFVKLWQNAALGSVFYAQNISLGDVSQYNLFVFRFRYNTIESRVFSVVMMPIELYNSNVCLYIPGGQWDGGNTLHSVHRYVWMHRDSGSLGFYSAYKDGTTGDNSYCIPDVIYGVKL